MATPLTADQLIAALKAEGLTVHEVRDWRTHNRNARGAWGPVNGVMLHHTASDSDGIVQYCYDGDASLPGPLCHGVIDKRGEVWLVGNGRANHAGGGDPAVLAAVVTESYTVVPPAPHYHESEAGAVDGNAHFYGFECGNKGDGKDPWPGAQTIAMTKAAAAICRHYNWHGRSVIGHKEWSDWKSDPKGIAMPSLRHNVDQCLKLKPGEWPKPATPDQLTLEQRVARIEKKLGIG